MTLLCHAACQKPDVMKNLVRDWEHDTICGWLIVIFTVFTRRLHQICECRICEGLWRRTGIGVGIAVQVLCIYALYVAYSDFRAECPFNESVRVGSSGKKRQVKGSETRPSLFVSLQHSFS